MDNIEYKIVFRLKVGNFAGLYDYRVVMNYFPELFAKYATEDEKFTMALFLDEITKDLAKSKKLQQ